MEQQAHGHGSYQEHGEPADQIIQELVPRGIGNDHHREEGDQRGEHHAVDEDHEAGAFQVLQLGVRDFTIHLRQAFFAAHGQQRMAEAYENRDEGDGGRHGSAEPAETFLAEMQIGQRGQRHRLVAVLENGDQAPDDENHHHYGGDLHDAERLLAGFMETDHVLAPEVNGDRRGEHRGEVGRVHVQAGNLQVFAGLVDQPAKVKARADTADGTGQDVVEHQGGDRELGQGATHGLVHHLIHAAAHEHAAAFDVDGAHRVREQHDGQDEPGRSFADGLLGDAAHIVGRGSQIAQHNGCRSPEGDKRQHDGGSDYDINGAGPLWLGHAGVL